MKKDFSLYYISRAILSCLFAILLMGWNWRAILVASVLFSLFYLYLHSGWFQVDPQSPLMPLRRDERGRQVQRKALISAIVTGVLAYLLLALTIFPPALAQAAGGIALSLAILVYFIMQFALFSRT
jgi:hypothetical protein